MKRVLAVDDVKDNITLLTFELEDDNFEVIPAYNGQECLDCARTKPQPDIILLDIHMPGLSGIETLKILKEDPLTHDIPVIMVSSNNTEESIVEAIDLKAHDFVSKPIKYPVLAARMRSALRLAEALTKLEQANRELNTLATTDALTGTYNRRHFFNLVNSEVAKMSRHENHVSIMMIDIDHFKQVNDTYSHAAGDIAIQALTACIRHVCRTYDIIGRLGGEEFAICSPHADIEDAKAIASRIRANCEAMTLDFHGQKFSITVSIGVTELKPNEGFTSALQRADELLYQAKHKNRNQVISDL